MERDVFREYLYKNVNKDFITEEKESIFIFEYPLNDEVNILKLVNIIRDFFIKENNYDYKVKINRCNYYPEEENISHLILSSFNVVGNSVNKSGFQITETNYFKEE